MRSTNNVAAEVPSRGYGTWREVMIDISIRKRGSLAYINGQSAAGHKWMKANMWLGEGNLIVTIQAEYVEHWISEMNKAELTYEYN